MIAPGVRVGLRCTAAAVIVASAAAFAGRTSVIDDTATLPYNANASLQWQALAPNRAANNLMDGTTTLQVRLNVAPWLNRNGRIYMVMPAQQPGPVQVAWTTQGRLLPGQMTSGTRALVYSGPISAPTINEVMTLKLIVDGTKMWQSYQLKFHFEIDED